MTGSAALRDVKWAYSLRSFGPVEAVAGLAVKKLGREALARLDLGPGMRVLDLGCGTGRSLAHLSRAVGPAGEVVGVDYTRAMLERARLRVEDAGLTNVRLIEADAADLALPPGSFDRVLCTYALSVIPRSRQALHRAVALLAPGGRIVVVDMKRMDPPTESLAPFWEQVVNPVYENLAYQLACAQPSREIVTELRRLLAHVTVEDRAGGAMYLAVADRPVEMTA